MSYNNINKTQQYGNRQKTKNNKMIYAAYLNKIFRRFDDDRRSLRFVFHAFVLLFFCCCLISKVMKIQLLLHGVWGIMRSFYDVIILQHSFNIIWHGKVNISRRLLLYTWFENWLFNGNKAIEPTKYSARARLLPRNQ